MTSISLFYTTYVHYNRGLVKSKSMSKSDKIGAPPKSLEQLCESVAFTWGAREKHSQGVALTVLDAVLQDETQRKAAKDLFNQLFWGESVVDHQLDSIIKLIKENCVLK